MIIGYTTGVYDLFHVGHVELLKNAKSLCDKLIVGLTIDDIVSYKESTTVIKYDDRKVVLESCKYVDLVIPQTDHNKVNAYNKLKYNILFVGDDWYQNDKWQKYEEELKGYGVKVIYFPYTKKISTTIIKSNLF
jgi:choline-phosphate cytidylyltransferase/glycerol-3-phosphate cytidylyltransferase